MAKTSGFFALFRTRLILLVLLVLVPAFGLVVYGYFEQRRIETARVREGATAICQLAAANQNNFIDDARQLLATMTQFPFLLLATNRPFCETHLSNLRKLAPDYLNFGLIETNGMLFASAVPANGSVNLGDRAYFQRVLQTRKFSAGDFQVGRLTGKAGLNFAYPVLNEAGELQRVFYASLDLSLLSQAVAQIELPPGGSLTVIDVSGRVLARHPQPEQWVGKDLGDAALARRMMSQKEKVFEEAGRDGVARLYAVTPVTAGGSPVLYVSVGIPLAVCFAHANQALARNFVVLGIVAFGVMVTARFYSRHFFLQPVNALGTAARELAQGNLNVRTGTISGAAELAQLAEAFDDMAERLQKRQAEIEQSQQQISRLNQDLELRVGERTAQLEAANKELEAFSYSVSHDLRAPLRHLTGFATLLQKKAGPALDEESQRHLSFIASAAKQMGQLVDDLLNFSKTARAELRLGRVNLEQLVDEVRAGLSPDAGDREVQWQISPLPEVNGDGSMLRVVLTNLLANALKYSRKRSPAQIEIGCQPEEQEQIIYVRDNGVGFDMQYASNLFGVFQRLHSEEEFEGTGIGLAIVQRIILRHGGGVWAEAKEGEGATFYFSLPIAAKTNGLLVLNPNHAVLAPKSDEGGSRITHHASRTTYALS